MGITPLEHSPLSASFCEAWWNCPGAIAFTRDYPSDGNKYTTEGTLAHELCGNALVKGETYAQICNHIGETHTVEGFEHEVTEEMAESVWTYVGFVRDKVSAHPGSILHVEQRIELPEVHDKMFATPDCQIIFPFRKVIVVDFKYGKGRKVDAWKNKQLMYYALRAFLDYSPVSIDLHIVQPRVNPENPVSSYFMDEAEMENFIVQLKQKAKEAMQENAPRVAGEWCQKSFCKGFVDCPQAKGKIMSLAKNDFLESPVERLSVTDLKTVLDNAKFITDFLSRVKDRAKDMLLEGENVPGYKLVKSYGYSKWQDEKVIEDLFLPTKGSAIYAPQKLKSPNQMKKVIGKKEVDKYSFRPENGVKVVSNTDKGELYQITKAADDFDIV